MYAAQSLSLPYRVLFGLVGILLVAVLYEPLELDDLPYSLSHKGRTAIVIWGIFAALWFCAALRVDALWMCCRRNRSGLLKIARCGGLYYGPILVALFYMMWVAGRLWLGYWPRAIPMHDPKGIPPSAVFHLLICGWFWYWPVAVLLPIGRAVHARITGGRDAQVHMLELGTTLFLMALSALWLVTDPQHLVRWFLD